MRILLIHASKFSYHVTEKTSAVSSLAELSEDQLKGSTGDTLVAFLASEKTDEKGIDSVARQAAATITDQAKQVKAPDVMLYPYAHLSSNLSSPRVATKVLAAIGERMREDSGLTIHEAPFG
ncbi:threonine--tRNA ligase, partial [bacterium]|nr:threonine--tRNA ligase [bacterium]